MFSCTKEFGKLMSRISTSAIPSIKFSVPVSLQIIVPRIHTDYLLKDSMLESISRTNQGSLKRHPTILYDILNFDNLILCQDDYNQTEKLSINSKSKPHNILYSVGTSIKIINEKYMPFSIELNKYHKDYYTKELKLDIQAKLTEYDLIVTKHNQLTIESDIYNRKDIGIIVQEH